MSQGAVDTKTGVYVGRLGLILLSLMFIAIAVIECVAILPFEFSKAFVRPAMWAGVTLWILVSMTAWEYVFTKDKDLGLQFVVALFFTATTLVSVVGFWMPSFFKLALWVNMAVSLFFLASAIFTLPKVWKDLRV